VITIDTDNEEEVDVDEHDDDDVDESSRSLSSLWRSCRVVDAAVAVVIRDLMSLSKLL